MIDDKPSEIITSESEVMKTQNDNLGSLNPKQLEIYRGLKSIGSEISALFLDGIKILNSDNLETKSYLLAHIAREIEGGLRDILSHKEEEKSKKKKLKDNSGHIISIATALGLDENDIFVKNWYEVAKKFSQYAHRHGAMKVPRKKSEFENIWRKFESVLFNLVGTYYNLLDRVDRVLKFEKPTKEIIDTLPNLLELDARYSYFFRNLKSLQWLKPLKEKRYFLPEKNPKPLELPDQPGSYIIPHWGVLDYLENVANKNIEQPSNEITNLIIEIINSIINYKNGKGESIDNYLTDWIILKIICTLPVEKIENQHIVFIGEALKSKWNTTLVEGEIGKTVFPKLINGEAKALIIKLIELIFEFQKIEKEITDKYISTMDAYWLSDALKKNKPGIAKLCGLEAVEIALGKIKAITKEDNSQFNIIWIPTIEDHPQTILTDRYECQLVHFVRDILEQLEPNKIKLKVNDLLKEEHPIFKRIALHIINYHYKDLRGLFWELKGNPLDEMFIKHELYELFKANCISFPKRQIKKVLLWIESKNYYVPDDIKNNKELKENMLAYRKREWLSALLPTKDPDVIAIYEKLEKINSSELEHPGFDTWSESGWGTISPIEGVELLKKSNEEIAEYLRGFKGENVWKEPSQEGLAETFRKCVTENPERFANDIRPFINVQRIYQHALLWGFSEAWRAKRNFLWDSLLNFVIQIIESDAFWNEKYTGRSDNYRNWIVSQIAGLIEEGTKDDNHAFEGKLLPQAEKILLVLVEKTESDLFEMNDLITSVLNSSKGKIFSAMVNYSLRSARLAKKSQVDRWVAPIKAYFDKGLNRKYEPSLEFSVTLGKYLINLCYLDEKWVTANINKIFPKDYDVHWKAAFTGYLFYCSNIHEEIYFLLRKNDHYSKAIQTNFSDEHITKKLVQHICIGYIAGWERLDDEASMITKLIKDKNASHFTAIINFFWMRRDKVTNGMKEKVKPLWKTLFDILSQNEENPEYQKIISSLAKWISLVDEIDEEILEWIKQSLKFMQISFDTSFFIKCLLSHAPKTPLKVGEIYLMMLAKNVYPDYDRKDIIEIVKILYGSGLDEIANKICNMYGEEELGFLRNIYDEYRK